eukprot:scaffold158578_cov24-Attheya_sp.AAC.1
MHKRRCENAAAVTSNLGGGNHGHLALLMTDRAYFEETQLAFIAPTKPGDDPPTALNPEEQPFVNDRYKRNQRIYEKYYGNTDKVLKKQIEATVEAAFISTLRHELTGFNQVTAFQMITHLYATYGVSDAEISFLQRAKGPAAKMALAHFWFAEFMTREHSAGSMGIVGPPIVSRLHQFLSDGMIFYNHARKITVTPFPFIQAQLSVFCILVIMIVVPLLMENFVQTLWAVFFLVFFCVSCLAGLHEVAKELENPFRNVPNNLPLCTLQAMYNESL